MRCCSTRGGHEVVLPVTNLLLAHVPWCSVISVPAQLRHFWCVHLRHSMMQGGVGQGWFQDRRSWTCVMGRLRMNAMACIPPATLHRAQSWLFVEPPRSWQGLVP